MSQDLLISSNVPWFRNDVDNVIRNIAQQTFNNPDIGASNMFRPSLVNDAESRRLVSAPIQRLIRWDVEHPNDIFHYGFLPRVNPTQGTYPPGSFDLGEYVQHNIPSIFVGTTHYVRTEADRLSRWERRLTQATMHRFEYEIFAYGGIDVNLCFGDHQYANQHEIAFPGGIRVQFIWSAREYQGTRVVSIWDNPRFDPAANGRHAPTWDELPHIIRGTNVPVYLFTERDRGMLPPPQDDHHHDELRRRRDTSDSNDDLMYGQGEQTVDEFLVAPPVPHLSRACFLDPTSSGRAYFFAGNQYVVINVKPGTTNDTIAWGPKPVVGNWPSLVKAGFGNVDAILPNPNNQKKEAYFFCEKQYALIKTELGTTNDYIVNGPKVIVNEWPSLKQAGFQTVDAVLPHPKDSSEAYIFSGEKYALIKVRPGSNSDYIINGPKIIVNEWPSLRKAGFRTLDAVLPNPSNSDEAYFFSGHQYALINIKPGSNGDYIVNGPKPIVGNWPSLHQALFY